jgi:hypothetical protein
MCITETNLYELVSSQDLQTRYGKKYKIHKNVRKEFLAVKCHSRPFVSFERHKQELNTSQVLARKVVHKSLGYFQFGTSQFIRRQQRLEIHAI